ncbi:hypothetical protein [Pedobacter miscanthi]|uniref:Uncharacterized protein n=1 Tax=Pedobacter miscanthi TaxID=2259170 RepID=A0A366L517_9SPHI|nr:hypothetical protein [Pedobacter miscanthi]RBQ08916.1 hypothetical protein DRW42_06820 [Pedobacter miscanthi]
MNDELINFRREIDARLGETGKGKIDPAKVNAALQEKSAAAIASLQQQVSEMKPAKGRLYLRHHQHALKLILGDLEKATRKSPPTEKQKNDLLTICMDNTELLLSALERHFPYYFDYATTAHQSRVNSYQLKFKEKSDEVLSLLAKRNLQPDTLKTFSQLLSSIQDHEPNPSYQSITYLEDFFKVLIASLNNPDGALETLDIILTLISLNFNHPAFYHFACVYINRETEKCENITAQYQTLHFLKKRIRQVLNVSRMPYNENQPQIADSLQRYLDAEIDYLKSIELTAEDLSSGGLLEKTFKVTFTVRQLALFIHLQVEAGIIIAQSPKALHHYAAKHYSTTEQTTISAKSFKNAYYGNTESDLEKVLEKIAGMLAIGKEKY